MLTCSSVHLVAPDAGASSVVSWVASASEVALDVGSESAGADPAPQDTTPVVIPPSSAPGPTPGPSATPAPVPTDDDDDVDDDDPFDSTVPAPRDYDDDADDPDDDDDD